MPDLELARDGLTARCPMWLAVAALIHGVTTRKALPQANSPDFRLALGRARVGGAIPVLPTLGAHQVHGTNIGVVTKSGHESAIDIEFFPNDKQSGRFRETDALICEVPGTLIVVQTADCLPLFLLDEENHRVGLAHCGWRGLRANLAGLIARRMIDRGSGAKALQAWLGPCIRADQYEVGPNLAAQFQSTFPNIPPDQLTPGGTHLDLAFLARRQLEGAGLPPNRIFDSESCTLSHPDLYHSYRGQGERAGRMLSFMSLTDWRGSAMPQAP